MPDNSGLIMIIAFAVILIVAVVLISIKRKKSKRPEDNSETKSNLSVYESNPLVVESVAPLSLIEGRQNLTEITDRKVIGQVKTLAPKAGGFLMNTQNAQSIKKYGESVKKINEANQKINESNSKEKLYRVIIKQKDAVLVDSKETEGAKRAILKSANKKGIQGQAELMEESYKKAEMVKDIPKAAQVINVVNVAVDVASFVVGQYYMSEINKKLANLSDSIDLIKLFQQSEYRSKINNIHKQIVTFSEHYSEIMDNDNNRTETLQILNDLNNQCSELLGQANDMIISLSSASFRKFDEYEERTSEIEQWIEYRNFLIDEMCYIAQMIFTFNKGEKSAEFCTSLLMKHGKDSYEINRNLVEWHKAQCEALQIDFDESRYKKTGLKAFVSAPIGWFKDDFKYSKIDSESIELIEGQMTEEVSVSNPIEKNLYKEDVELVVKDGKLYYLPQ